MTSVLFFLLILFSTLTDIHAVDLSEGFSSGNFTQPIEQQPAIRVKKVPRGWGVGVWFCEEPPMPRSSARRYVQYNCHKSRGCCWAWRTCGEYRAAQRDACNIAFGECVRREYAEGHLCRALLTNAEREASVVLMTRAQHFRRADSKPWRVG
ncbi:hypothetical protein M3Y99_00531300 [Aphelenchoides fujianensis]|nr:hypothetical protein M3Y99_00531300 [Aphelenchoides fujianensis]